jgi:hypothetical protein
VGNSATLSDIYSLLSDVASDVTVMSGVQSDIYSLLSDVASDLTVMSNVVSNTNTLAVGMSDITSDIYALLSDVSSRLPAALVGGRIDADIGAISTSTDAADKLEASAEIIIIGAVVSDALNTVSSFETGLTETTTDHYTGRVLVFTTGNLTGQATDLTSYVGATNFVEVTALTEVPAAGDSFVLL